MSVEATRAVVAPAVPPREAPQATRQGRAHVAVDVTSEMQHPAWCAGRCTVTAAVDGTQEAVHASVEVTLALDDDIRVQVALTRRDYWASDGTGEVPGVTEIVVRHPGAALGLSAAAARTLGRALVTLAGDAR